MKSLFPLLLLLVLVSCKQDQKPLAVSTVDMEPFKSVYGNWVGDFIKHDSSDPSSTTGESNKINIIIKSIINNKVTGHSIVAGNKRQLTGTVLETLSGLRFMLNEPGTDKSDGRFEFMISADTLAGKWTADRKLRISERSFKLVRREFIYDPKLMLPTQDEYVDYYSQRIDTTRTVEEDGTETVYYDESYRRASDIILQLNGSTTALTEEVLKNLTKLELEIIRNTIFARHGYTFKKKAFRQFFDPVDWYIPVSDDVTAELTRVEKQNIKLLTRFEKYAEEYYESFGR